MVSRADLEGWLESWARALRVRPAGERGLLEEDDEVESEWEARMEVR